MQQALKSWIIPVLFGLLALLFVLKAFPVLLAKLLPADVKSLHPAKKLLLGAVLLLASLLILFALCYAVATWQHS